VTAQRKAFILFGPKHQLRKLAEECSELAAAALRLSESQTPELIDHLGEEIADVEILIDGMRSYYGDAIVDCYRASKIARLEKRLRAAEPESAPDRIEKNAEMPEIPANSSEKQEPKPVNMPSSTPKDWLPIAEVADICGIRVEALTQAGYIGRIQKQKVGRRVYISLSEAQTYCLTKRRGKKVL
jgi:NTP pyrophosphatase (non-canonical NTP hydrolase)